MDHENHILKDEQFRQCTKSDPILKDSFLVKQSVNGYPRFEAQIVWKNAIGFLVLHLIAAFGAYRYLFCVNWLTIIWLLPVSYMYYLGVTVGAHRLFSHRSYKVNPFLKAILLICFTTCGQNCVYIWARDHRQHHMYSDTEKDPHDSSRGFFFSHMGWLMVRKHPAVIEAGKTVDMSDLEADKLVMFQKKYYKSWYLIFGVLLPMVVPMLFWNESLLHAITVVYIGRYMYGLNISWCVNSFAHLYGMHPYNTKQQAAENPFVSFICFGEGWHNYHHTYPWDYRCSEFGMKWNSNAWFIEMCAKLGWATDLRSASKSVVIKKVLRDGDGSHPRWGNIQNKSDIIDKDNIDIVVPRLKKSNLMYLKRDKHLG